MAAVRRDRSPPVQADVRRVLRDKLEPKQKDSKIPAKLNYEGHNCMTDKKQR